MDNTIIFLMNKYGYLGILLLIMIENIFPPIPSEIILGFGGYMTRTTNLTLFGVIFISAIGSCLGASILYWFGYIINKERLIRLTKTKIGKIINFKEEDIENANEWFLKRGYKSILFGRFIPVIRSIISIPAGISKMPFLAFFLLTFIGTFIWNGILTIIGSILGDNWYKIGIFIKKYSIFVIIISVLINVFLIMYWIIKRRKVKNKKVNM